MIKIYNCTRYNCIYMYLKGILYFTYILWNDIYIDLEYTILPISSTEILDSNQRKD